MSMSPELLRLLLLRQQQGLGGGKGGGQAATGGLGQVPGATPPIVAPSPSSTGQPQKQGLLDRFRNYVAGNLVPQGLPGTEGLTPEQQAGLRKQALQNYGAGLIGGAGSGRGLGRTVLSATLGAQEGLGSSLDRYQRQEDRTYARGRDTLADTRYEQQRTYSEARDIKADERQKILDQRQVKLDTANEDYRRAALAAEHDQSAGSRAQAAVAMERLKTERANHAEVTKIMESAKGRKLTNDELNRLQLLSGQSLPGQAYQMDLGDIGQGGIPMYVPGKGFVTPGQ